MRVCLLLSTATAVADAMSAARLLRRAWLGGGGDESNEFGKSSAVFLLAIIR
jgi:hypothetical protein